MRLNVFEMGELGKFIRKKRKEQGLRLEDLADSQISTATISNIERGVPHVNKEKIIYLLDRLKLDINEVPQMLLADSENRESMQLKFHAIETMLLLGKNKQAVRLLSVLPSKSLTYHQAIISMLKGKYYFNQQDWKKSERELSEAIRLAGQDRYTKKTNLIARCYDQLASCRMEQHDMKHALLFVERGIKALQQEDAEYIQTKHRLLVHQIDYLEASGRTDEALKRLDELWQVGDTIQDTGLLLHMYVLQTKLLRRVKLYQDVITCARKGIQYATGSLYYNEMFQLWMMLGMTYLDLYQLEDAETCFAFVQELQSEVQDRREMIRAYCSLSYLYLLQDQVNQAERIAQQAVQQAEAHPDEDLQEYIWMLYGQIKCKQEEWQSAIQYFEQAVAFAEKRGSTEASLQAYMELATCYHHLQYQDQFIQTITRIYEIQKDLLKDKHFSEWW